MRWAMMICVVLSCCWAWRADASQKQKRWRALLKSAKVLVGKRNRKLRRKGGEQLFQAYRLAPRRFRSLIAASHACAVFSSLSRKKRDIARWGKKGVVYAKLLIKGWPKRAEGYAWAAINTGHFARGGGVWAAITQGLAGKIERYAKASFKIDRRLYHGVASRILGRYYYRLPWPMRKLKRSLRYLRAAIQVAPRHPSNMLFLADTLWATGKKTEARKLYRKCAAYRTSNTWEWRSGQKCYKLWLKRK